MDDGERLLEHVVALGERREREAVSGVLPLVPAGAEPQLDPAAAHLVDRRNDLRQVAGQAVRDRAHQGPETDPRRLPGKAGERRPCVGRGLVARPRERPVVVGAKVRAEGRRGFNGPGEGQDLGVGEPLLGLRT